MKNISCIAVAILLSITCISQSADSSLKSDTHVKRYHVNYYVTGSIIAAGLVSDYFAISRLKKKPKITSEEYAFITTDQQKNLINQIDRWALKQDPDDRTLYKKFSDYGQDIIFALPALLMFDREIRKDWLDVLLMYVEGHVITFSFYNYSPMGPTFIDRYRPFDYYNSAELTPDYIMNSNNTRKSFFSGHVGSCAYSTFFMCKVYCDYHPELGALKYLLYLAASVPPLVISYARIKSLDHFPSDVAVGFGLGALVGIVVPALRKLPCSKSLTVGLSSSPDEIGLSLCWKLDNHRLRAAR